MFKDFDLSILRRNPQIAFYFRYPLHHSDFFELRENGRLLGRVAAKPLYGRLTREGKVDRSAGFNGDVAVLFIPARARSARAAELVLTHMPSEAVTRPDGKRDWPKIRAVAARAVRKRSGK